MFANLVQSHHSLKLVIACASIAAQLCACSTAADGGSDETDSGESFGPPDFDGEPGGRIVRCDEDEYLCVKRAPANCWLFNSPKAFRLYLASTCAASFDGVPEDYVEARPSMTYVTNYPHVGEASWEDCDIEFDHVSWTHESPAIDNITPFYEGTLPLTCDHEAYCSWREAARDEFGSGSIGSDPVCNLSPDGEDGIWDERPFQCAGSAGAACGEVILNGELEPETVCPVDGVAKLGYPGTDVCVFADDADAAASNCRSRCNIEHAALLEREEKGELVYTDHLNCNYYTDTNVVWVSDVDAQCAWQPFYQSGLFSVTTPEPFDFAVSLVTDGGLSTVTDDKIAMIDYAVGACSSGVCPITIYSVDVPHQTYAGTLSNPAAVYPYEVTGLNVELAAPVVGVVDETTGIVTFPSATFELVLTTGPIAFNSLSREPVQGLALSVTQVEGFVRAGELTLDVTYETIDAELSVTLSER